MASTRVNELDLLRFLAALGVVCFHYGFRGYVADAMTVMPYPHLAPIPKYSYFSLELFFLISGFVILKSASRAGLRQFAISRIVRLYPTFWVCCTLTFLVTLAIGAPRYSATLGQYLVNMTMLSGFFGVAPIDGVYWSLFVEILFYVVVGTALLAGRIHQFQLVLIAWLAAEIALEFVFLGHLPIRRFIDYSVCFIAGAAFFLIWSQGLSPARVAIVAVAWGVAILQSFRRWPLLEAHYGSGVSDYAHVGIITAFFLALFLVSVRRTGVFGRTRWLWAGALTYPLYLLHENIGFMVFNALYPSVNAHLLFWGTLAAALAGSFAVHVFVEARLTTPMRIAVTHAADRVARLVRPRLPRSFDSWRSSGSF
jgi:peptidoglycan/LPS O-acetylase OafA/YrhL